MILDNLNNPELNIYVANDYTVDTVNKIDYTKNNSVSRAQAEKQLQGQLTGQKVFKLKTIGETEIILSHETLVKLAELTKVEEVNEN
jgi:hypothetical protein